MCLIGLQHWFQNYFLETIINVPNHSFVNMLTLFEDYFLSSVSLILFGHCMSSDVSFQVMWLNKPLVTAFKGTHKTFLPEWMHTRVRKFNSREKRTDRASLEYEPQRVFLVLSSHRMLSHIIHTWDLGDHERGYAFLGKL